VDAVAKVEDRDRDRDKVKVKASVLSALRVAPTQDNPLMAQDQRITAHLALKAQVVTAPSEARATQPLKGCRVMTSITNPHRITKKTISNPVPMHIWVPKVV
jgi:hypothetical protein